MDDDDVTNRLAESDKTERRSQRDQLIDIGRTAKLFHSGDGVGYTAYDVHGHREVYPIRSTGCRDWLRQLYYAEHKTGPSSQAVQEAVETLDAIARYGDDSIEREVYQRVAWDPDGRGMWLDLCDAGWQAVHVTADGWRVVPRPAVHFTRKRGMLPLPLPERGGEWKTLWALANLQTDTQRIMAVAWLHGALRPSGPYSINAVEGEQGTGKSGLCRMLLGLIDPHEAASRRPPRDERDLFIAAGNAWIISYENLSGVPAWLSDALCTIATGGGYATRTLYADSDETIINACRPIMLNGIDSIATRGDLRDRTLLLTLDRIPDHERKSEAEMWAAYEAARPQLLGLLLDAASAALRNWDTTHLERAPRMADFARWVVAAERAGALPWEPTTGGESTFLRIYRESRESMTAQAVESDHMAQAIIMMLGEQAGQRWSGTASALADKLRPYVADPDPRRDAWMHNPRTLGNRLRRIAPDLANQGVTVTDCRDSGARTIQLEIKGKSSSFLSSLSQTPAKPRPARAEPMTTIMTTIEDDNESLSLDRESGEI